MGIITRAVRVTSSSIVDGEIVNADIAAGAGIVHTKMESDARARANHTGTQLAATVSDFAAAVALLSYTVAQVDTLLTAKAPLASPTFTGTVGAAAVSTTGNTTLGNDSGDTFKTHGTAGSGAQAAYSADVTVNLGDVPGTLTAIGAALNLALASVRNSGLMAAS